MEARRQSEDKSRHQRKGLCSILWYTACRRRGDSGKKSPKPDPGTAKRGDGSAKASAAAPGNKQTTPPDNKQSTLLGNKQSKKSKKSKKRCLNETSRQTSDRGSLGSITKEIISDSAKRKISGGKGKCKFSSWERLI